MKRSIKFAVVGLTAATTLLAFSTLTSSAKEVTSISSNNGLNYENTSSEQSNSFTFLETTKKNTYLAYYTDLIAPSPGGGAGNAPSPGGGGAETVVNVDGRDYYLNTDGSVKGNQFGESPEEYYPENKFIWYTDPQTSQIVCDRWCSVKQDGNTYWYYFIQMKNSKKGIGGAIVDQNKKIAGSWYHFDEQGRMLTNTFVRIDDGDYRSYAQRDGDFAVNKWLTIDGDKYYFKNQLITGHDESIPVALTGIQVISGKTYEFDSEGKLIPEAVATPSEASPSQAI